MATINTRSIKSSGGDYTSLANWHAGRVNNLVSNNFIEIAECYASAAPDTTTVDLNGWTTGVDNYIHIRAATGEGHSGHWDTSKYYMAVVNNKQIGSRARYLRIEGLQFYQSAGWTSDNQACFHAYRSTEDVNETRFGYNLCKGYFDGNRNGFGVYVNCDYGKVIVNVYNCAFWDFYSYGSPNEKVRSGVRWESYGTSKLNLYNCTIYHCSYGLHTSTDAAKGFKAINCLVFSNNAANFECFHNPSYFDSGTDYNLSDDATAVGTHSLVNKTSGDVAFVSTTETNVDFLAIGSGSTCVGAGTDNPYSSTYLDDIRRETRTSTWDIGADEYVAAGGGPTGSPYYAYVQQ